MSVAASPLDLSLSEFVDVGDGSVFVAMVGNGPPIILLHGWTLDHRMWEPQLPALGARYRLIMPDRRGFGRSTAPPDLACEAGDIVRIADILKLDTFFLAGLSQGAGVALDVAVRFPDRVAAVALAGTPLPGLVPDPDHVPRDDYTAMMRNGAIAEMRRDWLSHPLMQIDDDAHRALIAKIVSDYDGRDLLQPSAIQPFTHAAIAALKMPLLAITGDAETPWRANCARLLADVAPKGRFLSIRDAGHLTNIEQPAAFNAALLDFFSRATPHVTKNNP